MNSERVHIIDLPKKPKILRALQGDELWILHKTFPDYTGEINPKEGLVVLIDGRSYIGAFFTAVFFPLSLYPFAATIAMFAENGLSTVVSICGYIASNAWASQWWRGQSSWPICERGFIVHQRHKGMWSPMAIFNDAKQFL